MILILLAIYLYKYLEKKNMKYLNNNMVKSCSFHKFTSIYDTVFIFDIDDTLVGPKCSDKGIKAIELLNSMNSFFIGIVTARPFYPPDIDLRKKNLDKKSKKKISK